LGGVFSEVEISGVKAVGGYEICAIIRQMAQQLS